MYEVLRNHHSFNILPVVVLITMIVFAGCQQRSETLKSTTATDEQASLREQEQKAEALRVDPGPPDGSGAVKYYAESLEELGLKNWESLPTNPEEALLKLASVQNMQIGLAFLGYKDLIPADFKKNVENLSSAELMAKYPDEIFASAFFAPKITDVSVSDGGAINLGWRKLVYLKARPGSAAESKGISSGFLLFNKFQGPGKWDLDPIIARDDKSNESQTTQLMLVRAKGSALKNSIYFMVYGPLSSGGQLQAFLTASFDARDPSIGPKGKYFVPNACAQCHGAETTPNKYDLNKVKLNFLDTDHWFDRVQAGDDFAFIQQHPYGVLYDGDKVFDIKPEDTVSTKTQAAFNVLRQINERISQQNELVDEAVAPSFQTRAVRKWTALHASSSTTDFVHKDVFQRSLDGSSAWSNATSPDRELLPLVNRYCYRCHSSVRFSIYDRDTVLRRKAAIKFRLTTTNTSFAMPQDRVLSGETKQRLVDLVNALPTPLRE